MNESNNKIVKFGSNYAKNMIDQEDFDSLFSETRKLLEDKVINNKEALWFNYPASVSKNLRICPREFSPF